MRSLAVVLVVWSLGASPCAADALVASVAEGSAAAKAGLAPGDVLIDADGVPVRFDFNLEYAIKKARAAGADAVVLRVKRGRDPRTVRMGLDMTGLTLRPNDPPDVLQRELLALPGHRDTARATRAIVEAIDHAPGVGHQLLTDGIARWHAGDGKEGRSRMSLAGFVSTVLAGELEKVRPAARRAALEADRARLQARLKLVARWGPRHREMYVFGMRFQKVGVNFLMGGRHLQAAVKSWGRALEMYRKCGDVDNQVAVLANLGTLYQRYGSQPARSRPYLDEAWRLVERNDLKLERARIGLLRATERLLALDAAGALPLLVDARKSAAAVDQREREVAIIEQQAAALEQLRRPLEAEAALGRGLRRTRERETRARLQLQLGRLRASLGRDASAVACYRKGLRELESVREPSFTLLMDLRQTLYRAHLTAGELEDARALWPAFATLPWRMRTQLYAEWHATRARRPGAPGARVVDHWRAVGWQVGAGRLEDALRSFLDAPPIPVGDWLGRRK